jgi:MSHA biogenesis protein MshG
MTSFAWKGRDPRGELVEGVTDAASDAAVADQLLAIGVSPVSIAQRSTALVATPASLWEALRASPVSEEDLLLLSRQLYTLQKAGVPLLRSLAGMQASTDTTCAPAWTRAANWARRWRATPRSSAASTSPWCAWVNSPAA